MQSVKNKLDAILKENNIAGMSVAVTDKEKVVFAEGFGVESVERPSVKASAESLYRIASITKVVTGITLMRLREEGVLELDVPVNEYVPWLKLKSRDALDKMTLRHLLSHTSGLPAEYTPEGPKEEDALERTLKEGLPELNLASVAGEGKFLYSNWGIRLASYIAQERTGKMFTELAKKYVLMPLGMERTTFDLHIAATYPVCLPHTEDEKGELKVMHLLQENAARHAAGGLYSNVIDLSKLARFILNDGKNDAGEQILGKAYLDEMRTQHAMYKKPSADGYGLTMLLRKYGDKILYGHLGSAPPYATSLLVDPESGFGVVSLMNTEKNNLRLEIPEMIFDMIIKKNKI